MLKKIISTARSKIAFRVFRRDTNFILAAILSAYSVFVSFCFAVFVAISKLQDPSAIVRYGKFVIAAIMFAGVVVEVYYNYRSYVRRRKTYLWRASKRREMPF